jgi:hydrogenase-4 membrane subunit HyfE
MDNEILIVLITMLALQAVIMLIVIRKLRKDKESGYPLQDEMSRQLFYKAGAYAFLMAWPFWLIIFIVSSLSGEIKPNWDIWFGIMGMAVIFIATNLIVRRKGV